LKATLSIVFVIFIFLWIYFINKFAKLKTMPGISAVLLEPQNRNLWFRYSTFHFTDRCGRTPGTCLCFVLFYVLFVLCRSVCWLCVYICLLYFSHRVTTKLQLTNISYHIIPYNISYHISYHTITYLIITYIILLLVISYNIQKKESPPYVYYHTHTPC
jgi:hypothetical protein